MARRDFPEKPGSLYPARRGSMKRLRNLAPALAVLTVAGHVAPMMAAGPRSAVPAGGDPARGAAYYETRCAACHSLDRNRVGPRHRGVLGRRAGSVADYGYSTSLRSSTLVWTAENLDAWLTDPGALVPGQRMGFRVNRAQDRRDIIAYLQKISRERQP